MKINKKLIIMGVLVMTMSSLTGCSSKKSSPAEVRTVYREVQVETPAEPVPGVVEYVWEEPMIDVIDVPPGLDPEGRYYRRGHQSIVEVRQGRWRHYDKGN